MSKGFHFGSTIEVHLDAKASDEEDARRMTANFKEQIDELAGHCPHPGAVICTHVMDVQEIIQEEGDNWPSFVTKDKVDRAADLWKTLVMPHLKELDLVERLRNSVATGFLLALGFPYHEVVDIGEQFKKKGLL